MTKPRLIEASLDRRDADIALTWRVEGDLTTEPTPWLLAFFVIGGENGPIHQIGFRHANGRIESAFVFDTVAGMNYASTATPTRTGDTWTAVFSVSDDVARSGRWEAALAYDESHNENETRVEGSF